PRPRARRGEERRDHCGPGPQEPVRPAEPPPRSEGGAGRLLGDAHSRQRGGRLMVTAAEFVALARSQEGDRYIFGHEVSPSDSDPSAFDCSELIEWVGARLGVTPRIPDGSWNQYRHSAAHGLTIPVADAYSVRGALLFIFRDKNGRPVDPGIARPAQSHVAISLGDGRTIEARGAAYGVGVFTAIGRGWTHAALIPGVDYSTGHETPDEEGDEEMIRQLTAALRPEDIDRAHDTGVVGPNTKQSRNTWKARLANPDDPN